MAPRAECEGFERGLSTLGQAKSTLGKNAIGECLSNLHKLMVSRSSVERVMDWGLIVAYVALGLGVGAWVILVGAQIYEFVRRIRS
jgi:hypothetical protein